VYRRPQLAPGARLDGPCLIEERTGATVVPPGATCTVEDLALRLRHNP
jgi:N-methylhydantoinase A/oxoprolinase/acetone carboxylase beta subunit